MSVILLADAKKYLDVIHSYDDDKIQMLLDSAEDEALQFMDRANLTDWGDCCEPVSEPVSEQPLPGSVRLGIYIMLQAAYQASPADAEQLRDVAEVKLMPYRCNLGI
ncbi:head-tail connector protein [uncultured Gilvimarinus sp.]|uniref:head-tail connector protein n=1 Tax=uncultured Gilvimarinus sp. TaxID=1689143 RepID=UPI0030D9025D